MILDHLRRMEKADLAVYIISMILIILTYVVALWTTNSVIAGMFFMVSFTVMFIFLFTYYKVS